MQQQLRMLWCWWRSVYICTKELSSAKYTLYFVYENTPAELEQCFEPHGLSPSYGSNCNFPLAFFWGIHPCEELLCDMTLCDMTLFSVWNYLGFCICLSQWTLCLQRSLKRPLCISITCKKIKYLVCSFSFPSTCQFSGNATCYSSEKNQVVGWKAVFWLLTVSRYKVMACWV